MKWVDCECGLPISVLIKQALVNTVNCLFQMSIMIRRPARHDRLLGTKRADAAGFEPFDRQHVSDKYPHADGEITDRLGAGISRRRAALKYRERHHEKMKKGINRILGDQPDTVSTNLSETVATEYVAPDPIFEDTASISGISQTSYAHTLLSGQDSMTIPSLPKDSANESPFECPYCYFIITIKNQRSWARHIFSNIMPYTCVYLNCSTPSRLYESRREWFCHLQNAHSVGIDPAAKQDCPLCKKIIASGVQFQKHLGRHLEELALFAMPRTAEDDDSQSSAYPFEQSHSDPMEVNEGIGDVSAEDYVSVGNFFLEGSILDERFEINLEEIQKQISYIRPSAADTKKKADHEAQAELGKWEERLLQKYTEQEAEEAIKGEDLTPLVQVKSVKVHSDDIDPAEAIRLEQMEALEREKEEEKCEKNYREKLEYVRAMAEVEEAEKRQREAKMKREAIEEHLRMEAAKEKAEREEKEKKEKELEERIKPLLLAQGYSEQEAEDIIKVKAVKVHSDDVHPAVFDLYNFQWE